jgi:hypothetical protein
MSIFFDSVICTMPLDIYKNENRLLLAQPVVGPMTESEEFTIFPAKNYRRVGDYFHFMY